MQTARAAHDLDAAKLAEDEGSGSTAVAWLIGKVEWTYLGTKRSSRLSPS